MKKIICILLACAMSVLFVSCSSDKKYDGGYKDDADEVVKEHAEIIPPEPVESIEKIDRDKAKDKLDSLRSTLKTYGDKVDGMYQSEYTEGTSKVVVSLDDNDMLYIQYIHTTDDGSTYNMNMQIAKDNEKFDVIASYSTITAQATMDVEMYTKLNVEFITYETNLPDDEAADELKKEFKKLLTDTVSMAFNRARSIEIDLKLAN